MSRSFMFLRAERRRRRVLEIVFKSTEHAGYTRLNWIGRRPVQNQFNSEIK